MNTAQSQVGRAPPNTATADSEKGFALLTIDTYLPIEEHLNVANIGESAVPMFSAPVH